MKDIAICKMLKEENFILEDNGFKTKRKETVEETIEEIYIKECKIQIVDWKEKKKNL